MFFKINETDSLISQLPTVPVQEITGNMASGDVAELK